MTVAVVFSPLERPAAAGPAAALIALQRADADYGGLRVRLAETEVHGFADPTRVESCQHTVPMRSCMIVQKNFLSYAEVCQKTASS